MREEEGARALPLPDCEPLERDGSVILTRVQAKEGEACRNRQASPPHTLLLLIRRWLN